MQLTLGKMDLCVSLFVSKEALLGILELFYLHGTLQSFPSFIRPFKDIFITYPFLGFGHFLNVFNNGAQKEITAKVGILYSVPVTEKI